MNKPLSVAYLGNHIPSHSTESHVAASLESLGHKVVRIQEGETRALDVPARVAGHDLFLHTQTYGLATSAGSIEERTEMLEAIKRQGIPTVGYHLDRWWGLNREDQLAVEPFFRVDLLFTADGGHQPEWESLGINHGWCPPGVYHAEAVDGHPRRSFASDLIFVGSWRHYGHEEHWPVRREMLEQLRRRYGRRFACWPKGVAVRGRMLNDLYASCKLAIGDSCTTGSPGWYFSDRCTETLGRGALLVHPFVKGLDVLHPYIPTFPPGDWATMFEVIDRLLGDDEERERIRREGVQDVRARHTYRDRMRFVIETCRERGLL